MQRRILAVTALLAVFVACRDGPAELVAPREARTVVQPEVTVSQEAVTAVVDLFDDAFVRELMDGARARTDVLDGAVRDASHYGMPRDILALSNALTVTRSRLVLNDDRAEENEDELILRAALTLMLDDALMLLEEPPPMRREEAEGLGTDNTKPRSIER